MLIKLNVYVQKMDTKNPLKNVVVEQKNAEYYFLLSKKHMEK